MGNLSKDLRAKLSTVHSEYAREAQAAANEAEDTLHAMRERDRRREELAREERADLVKKFPSLRG